MSGTRRTTPDDPAAADQGMGWQRLDSWLWCARMLRHRADCARLVQQGQTRINRQPTDKPHARLRVGDVVTLPLRHAVVVLEVNALAARRGPAAEARTLYREIGQSPSPADGRAGAIAGARGCDDPTDTAYPQPRPESPTTRSAR